MLGADVAANIRKRQAPAQVQLTITRGVLVLVFDDALADKVAEPVRVAANPVSLLGYDQRRLGGKRQAVAAVVHGEEEGQDRHRRGGSNGELEPWRDSSPSYRWKFHGAHLSPLYKFEEEE